MVDTSFRPSREPEPPPFQTMTATSPSPQSPSLRNTFDGYFLVVAAKTEIADGISHS